MKNDIMLTVSMITYNHEKYIRQAVESILQQEVKFKYEIIIGDDCSTDKTVEIIEDLQREHPGLIQLIKHMKNVGAAQNCYDTYIIANGKYLTRLEGDDYWEKTDELQKSIDFLEKNEEYLGICRGNKSIDINGEVFFVSKEPKLKNKEANLNTFLRGKTIGTPLHRNYIKDSTDDFSIIYKSNNMVAEVAMGLLNMERGKFLLTNIPWEVKRYVKDPKASNYNSTRSQKNIYEDFMEIYDNIDKYYKKFDFSRRKVKPTENIIMDCIINKNFSYLKTVLKRTDTKTKWLVAIHIWKPVFDLFLWKVKRFFQKLKIFIKNNR